MPWNTVTNFFTVYSSSPLPTSFSAHGSTTTATVLVVGTSFLTATPSVTFPTSSRILVVAWPVALMSVESREVATVLFKMPKEFALMCLE
jgi:hypothetical protein